MGIKRKYKPQRSRNPSWLHRPSDGCPQPGGNGPWHPYLIIDHFYEGKVLKVKNLKAAL